MSFPTSSVLERPKTLCRSEHDRPASSRLNTAPASVEKLISSQQSALLKRTGASYWRKLMSTGIPQADARELAIALIRFNYLNRRPSSSQKKLIRRHCQRMGAVGLWRLELMLGQR